MKIVVIGAGAAGLMAAYTLSQKGESVCILEARDRVGGRVWPLDDEFGQPAQGGGEFVHGSAPVTKELLKKAGLNYVSTTDGEFWNAVNGELKKPSNPDLWPALWESEEFHEKLRELKQDLPVSQFLSENFADEKYFELRQSILAMVTGFDAADPDQISTFTLREEWLGEGEWENGRVKEGYSPLLKFLESECKKNRVEILLNHEVKSVETVRDRVKISCTNGKSFEADKAIVTVPVPLLPSIVGVEEKLPIAKTIGFGDVIKLVLLFKDQWWLKSSDQDMSRMAFIRSQEAVSTWWTQFPNQSPLLIGWIAGPPATKLKNLTDKQLLETGLESLANIFKVSISDLKNNLLKSKVANWPQDSFARGAYSYSTVETGDAYEEMRKPIADKIYFAGEAYCSGQESATVEGALASGLETANRIA